MALIFLMTFCSSNGRSVASKNGKSIANLNSELHDMPIIDASKLSATVEFKFEGGDSMALESYLQQAKVWTARKKYLFNFELSRLTVNFRDGLAKVSIFLERLQIRPSSVGEELVYQAFSEPIASYAVREQKYGLWVCLAFGSHHIQCLTWHKFALSDLLVRLAIQRRAWPGSSQTFFGWCIAVIGLGRVIKSVYWEYGCALKPFTTY